MATINNYTIINPLELPSNQAAAALFINAGIVGTTSQWAASPMATSGGAVMPGFSDASTAARTTCANAALLAERNARLAQQDRIQTAIAQLGAT